jgi:beta-phosphoglucomutase family hydrolase
VLGLPDGISACLFDLDGVLTDTAAVHNAAWRETFDGFLRERAERTGEPFVPFDPVGDYLEHVDGKRREDGVRDFLASRGIELPEGSADDAPDAPTVSGVGNRKNVLLLKTIETDGVRVYEGSRRYLQAAKDAGLRIAVVSSSANTRAVLEVTGLAPFIELRVDGVVAKERDLPGKPAPDTFLAAAADLGVQKEQCVVFEDALAGVAAGRAGDFGYVVGVDRVDQADQLREQGADVVVADLEELL